MAITSQGELGRITTDLQRYVSGLLNNQGWIEKSKGLTNETALAVANYMNQGGRDKQVIGEMLAQGGANQKEIGNYTDVIAPAVLATFSGLFDVPSVPTPPSSSTDTTNTTTETPESKPETVEEQAKRLLEERNSLLDKLTGLQTEQAGQAWGEQTGQLRGAKIKEQSALGMLEQPLGQERINKFDIAAQKSLKDVLGQIQQQSLREKSGFAADVLPTTLAARESAQNEAFKQQSLLESIRQFNENLALGREKISSEANLATLLGRMQAEAGKPGVLDYTNTGLTGLGTLGTLWGAWNQYQANKNEKKKIDLLGRGDTGKSTGTSVSWGFGK